MNCYIAVQLLNHHIRGIYYWIKFHWLNILIKLPCFVREMYRKYLKKFSCVKDAKFWFSFIHFMRHNIHNILKNMQYRYGVQESSSCDSSHLSKLILAIIEFLCFSFNFTTWWYLRAGDFISESHYTPLWDPISWGF